MKTLRVRLLFPVTEPFIEDGKLILDNKGEIIYVGKWDGKKKGELITWDGIAFPGFVNCHVHLELCGLKNKIPKGLGVTNWVRLLQQKRALLRKEDIKSGIIKGIEDMKKDGIVAIGEVGNSFSSLEYLANSSFNVIYFFEVLGFMPDKAEEIFINSYMELKKYQSLYPKIKFYIAPHAFYSTSEKLIKLIFSNKEYKITTIHIAEGEEEIQFLQTGNGPWKDYLEEIKKFPSYWKPPNTSPVLYLKILAPSKKTILVHLCNLSRQDIDWLKQKKDIFNWDPLIMSLYLIITYGSFIKQKLA